MTSDVSAESRFASMSYDELNLERERIIRELKQTQSLSDPSIPLQQLLESAPENLLRDLAYLTAAIRRKNAGPPKTKPTPAGGAKRKVSAADLLAGL